MITEYDTEPVRGLPARCPPGKPCSGKAAPHGGRWPAAPSTSTRSQSTSA